jgi:hypothetical protein
MAAAAAHGTTAGPAYTSGSTTYYFVNYYSASSYFTAPYTLNGSLVSASSSLNGTVTFTGGNVTQITYNNVTSTSGNYQITFVGGLVYTYDLATHTFTLT